MRKTDTSSVSTSICCMVFLLVALVRTFGEGAPDCIVEKVVILMGYICTTLSCQTRDNHNLVQFSFQALNFAF